MKNINNFSLSQLYEKPLHNGRVTIYTRANNFKPGELDKTKLTFYSVRRSHKNIMRMYNALGLNEELLLRYDFKFIVIPFYSSFLMTYRKKWIIEGIKSPFSTGNVDCQILLPLHKINMDWDDPAKTTEQLSLFGKVG